MTDAGARQRLVQQWRDRASGSFAKAHPYAAIVIGECANELAALSEGEAPSVIERPVTYQIHPRDREAEDINDDRSPVLAGAAVTDVRGRVLAAVPQVDAEPSNEGHAAPPPVDEPDFPASLPR